MSSMYRKLLARRRMAAARSIRRPVLQGLANEFGEESPQDAFVDAWVAALGHPSGPRHLTPQWTHALAGPSSGTPTLDWLSHIAQGVRQHATRGHQVWMLAHLQSSMEYAKQIEEAHGVRANLEGVLDAALKNLPEAEPLREPLATWLQGRAHPSLEDAFESVVADFRIAPTSWRRLWRQLDGAIAATVRRWPHALSPALRVLAQATPRYPVLRRLRRALAPFPAVWSPILRRTLTTTDAYSRRLLPSFPFPRGAGLEPNEALNLTRDALLLALDLERSETDPAEDAGEWVSAQYAALGRAEEIRARHAPALRRLQSVISEGLPLEESEFVSHFVNFLVDECCIAAVSDHPREHLAHVVVLTVDCHGPHTRRYQECLHRLAHILDAHPDIDLASLARAGVAAIDKARALPARWSDKRAPTERAQCLVVLGYNLLANTTWMPRERAVSEAANQWSRDAPRGPNTRARLDDLSAWSAPRHTDPEPALEVLPRLLPRATEALAAIELGTISGLLSLTPQAHWTAARQSLLWESAWQLWLHTPDPAQQIWNEWSTHNELGMSPQDELQALLAHLRPLLTPEAMALCESVMREIFGAALVTLPAPQPRADAPRAYRVEGPHWRRCFGPVNELPPLFGGRMPSFLDALRSSGDAETAALRAAGDDRHMNPEPENEAAHAHVWRHVHTQLVERCGLDLSVGRALQLGHAALASEVALGVTSDRGEQSRCIKEQFGFLKFFASRILAVPASLAALDSSRYLVMVVAPNSTFDKREWNKAFSILRGALGSRLARRERLTWARWCEQLMAMSAGLATLGGTEDLFDGSEPVFAEDFEEDVLWRNLVGGILAAAITSPDAPIPADALIQRLVLSDPLLGRETAASWQQRSRVLTPFLAEYLPSPWSPVIAATVDAIGVALKCVEEARSQLPRASTTSAQLLSAVPGMESRWRADHLYRHQLRRGIRDPADLSVIRSTGWSMNTPEQIERLASHLEHAVAFEAPTPRTEGGGLFRFLRGETSTLADGDPGKNWMYTAILQDYLGSTAFERREALLAMQEEAGGMPIHLVTEPVIEASGLPIRERAVDMAMASLASKLTNPNQLAAIWANRASLPKAHIGRMTRDLTPLLEQVYLVASGVSHVDLEDWYRECILPHLAPPSVALWTSVLQHGQSHLSDTLGPDAKALAVLLRPLTRTLNTQLMEAG